MDYLKEMISNIEQQLGVVLPSYIVIDLTRVFIVLAFGYGAGIKGMLESIKRRFRFQGFSGEMLDFANQTYKIVLRERINGEWEEITYLSHLSYEEATTEQKLYASKKSAEGYKVCYPKQFNNTIKLFKEETQALLYMEIVPNRD